MSNFSSKLDNPGDFLIEVVDHSTLYRKMLCKVLQDHGFPICEASNGQEAIEVFDQHSPKLVLMSYEMPGLNGVDACRRIRAIDRDEYSPVIIITSNDDDAFIAAAFQAGAADYVTKPVKWQLLIHRIEYMLHMSKATYALEASEKRFRQLFDDSPLPYQSLNEQGEIVDVNKAWLDMMGLSAEEAIGKSFGDFMPANEWRTFLNHFPRFIKSGVLTNLHLKVNGADNQLIDIEMNARVATDIDGNFKQTHGTLQNITERIANEEKLVKMATTDPLTGLNNRRSFFEMAERERLKALRFHHPYSAMMLDIDHFKSVNDTYGHNIGDEVLKFVADILKSILRDIDILGRLGGEEFAIVLPETPMADALKAAERIRAAVEDFTLETETCTISVTISIGVVQMSDAEEDNETLLNMADALLYQAKESGRNRVEYELKREAVEAAG